jgi:hypothetical protein
MAEMHMPEGDTLVSAHFIAAHVFVQGNHRHVGPASCQMLRHIPHADPPAVVGRKHGTGSELKDFHARDVLFAR